MTWTPGRILVVAVAIVLVLTLGLWQIAGTHAEMERAAERAAA